MNKSKLILAIAAGISFFVLLVSCDKKIGKLESAVVTPPPAGFCDTITFSKHINPIIQANCATPGCHATGSGNGDYTTYAGTFAKVSNGRFKLRVFDSPGSPMPPSGMLPQKQLDLIKCWLDKGAPND